MGWARLLAASQEGGDDLVRSADFDFAAEPLRIPRRGGCRYAPDPGRSGCRAQDVRREKVPQVAALFPRRVGGGRAIALLPGLLRDAHTFFVQSLGCGLPRVIPCSSAVGEPMLPLQAVLADRWGREVFTLRERSRLVWRSIRCRIDGSRC